MSFSTEYIKLKKSNILPDSLPLKPYRFYKTRGWISWRDYLNSNMPSNIEKNRRYYKTYKEAKEKFLAMNLTEINSESKYHEWHKEINLSDKFPLNPHLTYKNKGWTTWGNFLGTGKLSDNVKHANYLNYDDTKKYVQENLYFIKSSVQWEKYCKKNKLPFYIPLNPQLTFKRSNTWMGWGNFLSTNNIINSKKKYKWLNYEQFIQWFIDNNILVTSYRSYSRVFKKYKHLNLFPSLPDRFYKNYGWISWMEFCSKISCVAE